MGEKATVTIRSRHLNFIDRGELQAKYSADGRRILRWYIDLRHNFLNVHKELSAPELFLLQHKINMLTVQWDLKTEEHQRRQKIFASKAQADQETLEATAKLDDLQRILVHTLSVNDKINWSRLKDYRRYEGQMQFLKPVPTRAKSPEPQYSAPTITFFDKLFGKAKAKLADAKTLHEREKSQWAAHEREADAKLNNARAKWLAEKTAFEAEAERKKQAFLDEQAAGNQQVDILAANVASGDPQAVVEHAGLVLEASEYGDLFEKSYEIEYEPASKTLLLDYQLPSPETMPTVKSVRFIKATGELKETHISDREQKSNYDSVCYQICLRTIHELLEADEFENLDRILFNGHASFIDKATGQDTQSTIMSILVSRGEFQAIDLGRVDPKACFKSLKGVSASSLAALAPIAPVMKLNKEDRRFIDPRETANLLDEATNLAAMDWEDFEHLVREVFEKEFVARGGEVKITQSSSDGGVDAVAFDPDPITGGKIVIQAKRYTRTVGVAAVRDLYGTMQHEQASRGILVTTADYGPDAHKFSAGKPITLLTGQNLLHLLDRHGIKAKIDLREARKVLNLREYG